MAFKMKGSPHKMGGIKGTSGHVSALKQHAQVSALKQQAEAEASALKRRMKSPLEQEVTKEMGTPKIPSKLQHKKKAIKDGFKGTDTEKVVNAVKKVAGKVKKFKKSLEPTKDTKVTSDGDTTTATTTRSKKKLFGGKKTTTTSTSRDEDSVDYVRGATTKSTTRRGGGKKKEVTIDASGKKTVVKYDKEGNVKKTKVKKGTYENSGGKNNSNKLREKEHIRKKEKSPMEQKDATSEKKKSDEKKQTDLWKKDERLAYIKAMDKNEMYNNPSDSTYASDKGYKVKSKTKDYISGYPKK